MARQHIPALDGLRGLAILTVIAHHQLLPFTLKGGFLGVDLFFVLSGFLITSLLLSEVQRTKTVSLRNFYLRRVLRLGPALIVYLLFCLLYALWSHKYVFLEELKLTALALAYSTNWRMAFDHSTPLDLTSITWSLSIEEQFYLVWPIVFFVCHLWKIKRAHLIIGLALVIGLIAAHRLILLRDGAYLTRLYYGTDTRTDAPLMGCLIALIAHTKYKARLESYLKSAGIFAALFLSYFFLTSDFSDRWLYGGLYTVIAFMAGIVVWGAAVAQTGVLKFIYQREFLRWLGRISYGLYLWHWFVIKEISFPFFGRAESWAKLCLAIGIAAFSYYVIERRFLQLKSRFTESTL